MRYSGLDGYRVSRADAFALQLDSMIAWRQVGDRDRRNAAIRAIHNHLRPGRFRLHRELAGDRGLREFEVLRHFGASSYVQRDDPRHAAAAQLENVDPGATVTRAGVVPCSIPSTNTGIPVGFD